MIIVRSFFEYSYILIKQSSEPEARYFPSFDQATLVIAPSAWLIYDVSCLWIKTITSSKLQITSFFTISNTFRERSVDPTATEVLARDQATAFASPKIIVLAIVRFNSFGTFKDLKCMINSLAINVYDFNCFIGWDWSQISSIFCPSNFINVILYQSLPV